MECQKGFDRCSIAREEFGSNPLIQGFHWNFIFQILRIYPGTPHPGFNLFAKNKGFVWDSWSPKNGMFVRETLESITEA